MNQFKTRHQVIVASTFCKCKCVWNVKDWTIWIHSTYIHTILIVGYKKIDKYYIVLAQEEEYG